MRKKIKKCFIKPLFALCSLTAAVLFAGVLYLQSYLPANYYVYEGSSLSVQGPVPLSCEKSALAAPVENTLGAQSYSVNLKAFGVIPVKSAAVQVINNRKVKILGTGFGIKIYTAGVMVVKLDTVDTERGQVDVAGRAGVKLGDVILKINGQAVGSNEQVAAMIEKSGGDPLKLTLQRNGKTMQVTVVPELSYASGKYKAGIWVRDSSAGIGTLTFYSPGYSVVCGLGHGVYDADTGELLTVNSGELVNARIIAVKKGIDGCPGQLEGVFEEPALGSMLTNCETGVYASYSNPAEPSELKEIALKQQVQPGKAQILCTVDEGAPQLYDCVLEKVTYNNQKTKNMVVRVTDKALLQKTGGIVQGMSGSPILQNGKLVGAVTHVLVDDPTTGYGIFAENMLETVKSAAKQSSNKAS